MFLTFIVNIDEKNWKSVLFSNVYINICNFTIYRYESVGMYISIYTPINVFECTVTWNNTYFNVLIYFIMFVYTIISCGKYITKCVFLCLKIVDLLLATLQF